MDSTPQTFSEVAASMIDWSPLTTGDLATVVLGTAALTLASIGLWMMRTASRQRNAQLDAMTRRMDENAETMTRRMDENAETMTRHMDAQTEALREQTATLRTATEALAVLVARSQN